MTIVIFLFIALLVSWHGKFAHEPAFQCLALLVVIFGFIVDGFLFSESMKRRVDTRSPQQLRQAIKQQSQDMAYEDREKIRQRQEYELGKRKDSDWRIVK